MEIVSVVKWFPIELFLLFVFVLVAFTFKNTIYSRIMNKLFSRICILQYMDKYFAFSIYYFPLV